MHGLTPPVIVLGMHRSGTSLVTGLLEDAGLYVGDVNAAAKHNAKGNRENETLRAFHETMLTSRGLDWKTPPNAPIEWTAYEVSGVLELLRPYQGQATWGFKDPRTVWLLEGYLDLFPDCKLIAPFRNPVAVANSLHARPGSLRVSIDEGLSLWRKTNEKLLQIGERHALTLLHFDNSGVSNPLFHAPLNRFLKTCGLTENALEFFESGLVHHADQTLGDDDRNQAVWDRLIHAAKQSA